MNSFPENIFLVGVMGAGKTTVGRLLAKKLGRRFVDSDHEIEARCGVRIPTIFEINHLNARGMCSSDAAAKPLLLSLMSIEFF